MNDWLTLRSIAAVSLLLGTLTLTSSRAHALGEKSYVSFAPTPDAFALSTPTVSAPIYVDNVDWPGVQRAAFNLASDIAQVTGRSPELIHQNLTGGESIVLIGTIGNSPLIDRLMQNTSSTSAGSRATGRPAVTDHRRAPFAGSAPRAGDRRRGQARHDLSRSTTSRSRLAFRRGTGGPMCPCRTPGRPLRRRGPLSCSPCRRSTIAGSSSTMKRRRSPAGPTKSSAG